jgi:DNA-binding response OmpR family regulator
MSDSKRILLVDRDAQLLKELAEHCRAIGLEVLTAPDGATAAQLLEQNAPDLICVDDQLPGGDGLSLCEMIVASPDDVACPVVVFVQQAEVPRKTCATEMCVYYLHRRQNLWRYLEPIIYELVDIQPASRRSTDQGHGISGCVS